MVILGQDQSLFKEVDGDIEEVLAGVNHSMCVCTQLSHSVLVLSSGALNFVLISENSGLFHADLV